MKCPKCDGRMELVVEPEADAHRCTQCHGLWFDMRTHELLKRHADEIDTGDAMKGRGYNLIDRIKCPVCVGNLDLIRMVDPGQPHIWFESCQNCFGRFYDAGEFRDFAEHDWRDLLKDLRAVARD